MGYDTINEDIRFLDESSKLIFDPLKIESEFTVNGETSFTVTNLGTTSFSNLGLYIAPTSNLGPWDNPAENPPATDYQDLLTWGSRALATLDTPGWKKGGLKLYYPATSDAPIYITRTSGSMFTNRIKLSPLLLAGGSLTVRVEFEVPAEVDARRLYISVVIG